MKSFAEIDQDRNGDYLKLLSIISKLSRLFSDSPIPYIYYRLAENIFCRTFNAKNLSRSDTAFDASLFIEKNHHLGVGLKTFVCKTDNSLEKVAEFNKLSKDINILNGRDLALKISDLRNQRIELAKRLYNVDTSIYHIVARRSNELILFETDYNSIDINNISSIKTTDTSLQFNDGKNQYSYNFSKSTLFRKFIIPNNSFQMEVEIIEEPYDLLLKMLSSNDLLDNIKHKNPDNSVILPLYGYSKNEKFVFEKSGLNQWNAGGRKRNFGEIYIPIPSKIHEKYPNFFPNRDEEFNLKIPTEEIFSAKVCQENSKALMTNPNKALSDWLLRKLLMLKEGELATIQKLNELGFDSVIITKEDDNTYKIDKAYMDAYEKFINYEE